MNTSYFSKSSKNPNAVSIARSSPVWYTGQEYKKLAPSYNLLMKYKNDGDQEYYIKKYNEEVLDKLNPSEVFKELGSEAILLCWEGPKKFCHRHLVANWFENKLGIKLQEI